MVGFIGNTLYFSEPYLPHAWPFEYTKTTQDDIVGIDVYGQTLVVATKGKPYLCTGSDSASMTMQQLDADAPCLNKGGVVSTGGGVTIPTPDGLMVISASAPPQLVTADTFNRVQWAAAWSTTMEAVFHDGRFIAFSRESGKPTLMIELVGGKFNVSTLTVSGRAPVHDPDDDTLQFIAGTRARTKFEAGPSLGSYTWTSRIFTLPFAVNLSAGQPPSGPPPQSFDIIVSGPEAFRLPGGFMSRDYQIKITGSAAIQRVTLTDNMDELRE
jgi:hypothetical protein